MPFAKNKDRRSFLSRIAVAGKPIDDLFAMLVEGPKIAVSKERRMRILKLLEKRSGSTRKAIRHVLVVGFQKFRKSYKFRSFFDFFLKFNHMLP